jgi:hypothetical protein
MPLKNYTSEGRGTFEKIQNILTAHGANRIMYDYNTDGTLKAITFGLEINGQQAGFKLPALVENVTEILYGGEDRYGRPKKITQGQRDQAYKTACPNIRDWIDAQMAMVDTRQVKLEQVFLPYLVQKNGNTLYENIVANPSMLLGSGDK